MGEKKEKKEKKDKEKEEEKATVRSAPDGSDNNWHNIKCEHLRNTEQLKTSAIAQSMYSMDVHTCVTNVKRVTMSHACHTCHTHVTHVTHISHMFTHSSTNSLKKAVDAPEPYSST